MEPHRSLSITFGFLVIVSFFGFASALPTVSFTNLLGVAPGTPTVLHEDTTAETALAIIVCTPDATATEPCTCNLRVTNPVNGPFDVWRLNLGDGFRVYFVGTAAATQALDYDTVRTHFVTVTCTDGPNPGDQQDRTLEVDIRPNIQPQISGYPAVTTPTFDAQSELPIGSIIYSVIVSDAENDAITYTMTQNPDSNYLLIGGSDGIIRTAVDLRTVTTDTIICTVSVSDGKNTLNGFVVTVKLTNLNTRPVITNLPATINVTENQITGFTLTTLTFTDATPQTQVLEPECSVDPVAESYKFTYEEGTRKLKLNTITTGETLLDFETTDKYLISCIVFDGFLYSEGDVLTMHVNNVNEPPVFNQALYYCTMPESNVGVSTCDLGLTVTDPELNPINTLELLNGNNSDRFRYDRTSDKLTFNVDYDVDDGNMPQHVVITIYAVDTNRATGTSKIEINIQDANDNRCDFGSLNAAQFTIDQGTTLRTLGSLAAQDNDLTFPNNDVHYEVLNAIPVGSSNYLTVFSNGEIKYIGLIPETDHGRSYGLTVICVDGGSPPLRSTATVQVSYLTTTTTTTPTVPTTTTPTTTTTETTTAAPDTSIWDDSTFVVIFVILMIILGLALLAAVWYFCCRNPHSGFNNFLTPRYERYPPPPPTRYVRPAPERERRRYDSAPYSHHHYQQHPHQQYRQDDYFRSGSARVSPDYKDHAWRNGDHFEDGLGYDGRPLTKSDIFLTHNSNRPRALPPPPGRGGGGGGGGYI